MADVFQTLTWVVFIGLGLYFMYAGEQRSRFTLQRWAEARGYGLAAVQRRWFFQGWAWWWRASDRQRVYDVVLIDRDGSHKPAEVCVGGWFAGSLSDEVRVKFKGP